MRRLKLFILAAAFGLLAGNARAETDLENRAWVGAGTDAATTLVGLALGAVEGNPLGPAAMVLKIPVMAYIRTLPEEEQPAAYAQVGAMWQGVSVHNGCIIATILLTAGALAPVCPMLGAAWGFHQWDRSAQEREFWAICASYRRDKPDMKCTYQTAAKE